MAARLNPSPSRPAEVVDLRRLNPRNLEPLLQEETDAWWHLLEWDFEKSADLVRRFLDLRALSGFALVDQEQTIGYVYFVLEENKGLMGDLYVLRDHRTAENENLLLDAAIRCIAPQPTIERIESQLMMLDHAPGRAVPYPECFHSFERNFMRIELHRVPLSEGRVRRQVFVEHWNDQHQEAAARLIAQAYDGHVDSRINDQYRTPAGARRFLYNIVQYPGCGSFFRPASFAAFDSQGTMVGISLASLVAQNCGHVTQICVSPEVKGSGIGHALLRQSLLALRDMGCHAASLTVTAANQDAVALYERVGFRTIRRFCAWVWEGLRQPSLHSGH